MSTQITLNGNQDVNIVDYVVQEDSTPLSPLDNSGGVSQLTVTVADSANPSLLLDKQLDIYDTSNGSLRVKLNDVNGDLTSMTFAGTSVMQRLNSEIYCPPAMNMKLSDYLNLVLQKVGVSATPQYKASVGDLRVTAIGWRGVLWDKLKDICSAYSLEMSAVADQFVIRPVRGRIAETSNQTDVKWALDKSNLATDLIVVDYRATSQATDGFVYPWAVGRGAVITADAGETVTVALQTVYSLASIVPPQYGIYNRYDPTLASTFAVTNGKNQTLSAQDWLNSGGTLTAKINPTDDTVIDIVFRAPSNKTNGPYRVGIPDGRLKASKGTYSSLRILGTGVRFSRREIPITTCVPTTYTTQVREEKMDNIFASTTGKAFTLAQSALVQLNTYGYGLNVTTDYINRMGETGILTADTYGEFNTESGALTYSAFNTAQGAKTYAAWKVEKEAGDINEFENQAFGNVAGARHTFRNSYFRIRSAQITPDSISYSAEQDTTHADFAATWSDTTTYAQFNTAMGDQNYLDFGVQPLWRP